MFLTAYDLSKRWKWTVRPRTLKNWRGVGRGPKWVKVGTLALYRLEDVEAHEASRTSGGVPPAP